MPMKISAYKKAGLINIFISGFILTGCGHSHDEEADHHDDEEHHHEIGFVMNPAQAEKFKISFDTVRRSSFQDIIKTGGSIESSSSDLYTVTAKKNGIVTLANGINMGATVNSGALIASISSKGLEGGDVSKAAMANLTTAKAEYERLKPLYEANLVTAATFKEAERAYNEAAALAEVKTSPTSVSETSPVAGSITQLFVNSGQYVEMGAPIATLAKNSRLTLRADVPSRHASRIANVSSANFRPEGSDDIVKLKDLDGHKISGASSNVSSGYIPVYFSFSGNSLSHPGGYAEVFLLSGEREGVISVPRKALLELQGNKYIYVVHDGQYYEKRLLKTGADNGERVEVLDGLSEGEQFVADGATIVRMAEVSAVAPPSHTHNH